MPLLGIAPVFSYLTLQVPEDPPAHPWLNPPADILPGKREHVSAILVAMGFLDRYGHADQAPVRFPLLAQPVLEACLRVPTWMANAGGRNRAVARDAFKDRLPSEVFHRQSKGGLTGFMGQAFEANRAALADQLVRGWLVTAELVDRSAVEASLAKPAPNALEMARLLYLADVEAWARTWPIKSAASA
jgi:asparagine synthase (glutamine-hydrolysing)